MLNFKIDGQETNIIHQNLNIKYNNKFTHFEKNLSGELWVKDLYDYIIGENYDHNFTFEISGDFEFQGFFLKTDITIFHNHKSIKIDNVKENSVYQTINQAKDKTFKIGDLNVQSEEINYALEPSFLLSSEFYAHKYWDILNANGYKEFSAKAKNSYTILEDRYYEVDYPEHNYTTKNRLTRWIYIPYKDGMQEDYWGMYYYSDVKHYSNYSISKSDRFPSTSISDFYLRFKYSMSFGYIKIHYSSELYEGSVDVATDNTVTYVSGDKFNTNWEAGKEIEILGYPDFITEIIDDETLTIQNGFSEAKSGVGYMVEGSAIITFNSEEKTDNEGYWKLVKDTTSNYYAITDITIYSLILSNLEANDFSTWDSGVTYNSGDIVERNGEVYEALTSTQGEKPENNSNTDNDCSWFQRSNDLTDSLQNYNNAYYTLEMEYNPKSWIGTGDPDITIDVSHDYSNINTGYGKIRRGKHKGKYYKEPARVGELIPIMKEWWAEFSIWMVLDSNRDNIINKFKSIETVGDNYNIQRLTDALLEANNITDEILLSGGIIIAQDQNPIEGVNKPMELFLTPSTNVSIDQYYFPASANEISLQKIFDILKGFKIHWDLVYDDYFETYILRFEHFTFYNNGKQYKEIDGDKYYGENAVDLDLTTLEARNGGYWADTIIKTTYKKSDKQKYHNYTALDKKSKKMDAQLEVINNFVEDSIEIRLDAYIDFIIVTRLGEDVQKDAWVLINTDGNNNVEKTLINGYEIQNGSLFGDFVLENYYRYDLPGDVAINDIQYSIIETERLIEEEYKGIAPDFNPERLVKTNNGIGKISDLTIYLNNRKVEMTIKQKL